MRETSKMKFAGKKLFLCAKFTLKDEENNWTYKGLKIGKNWTESIVKI